MSKTSIIRARLARKKYTAQQIFVHFTFNTAMPSFYLTSLFFFFFFCFDVTFLSHACFIFFSAYLVAPCKKARNFYGKSTKCVRTKRERDR